MPEIGVSCNQFERGILVFPAKWKQGKCIYCHFISLPFGHHTCVKSVTPPFSFSRYFPLTLSVWFPLTLGCLHLKSHHCRLSFAAFPGILCCGDLDSCTNWKMCFSHFPSFFCFFCYSFRRRPGVCKLFTSLWQPQKTTGLQCQPLVPNYVSHWKGVGKARGKTRPLEEKAWGKIQFEPLACYFLAATSSTATLNATATATACVSECECECECEWAFPRFSSLFPA